MDKKEALKMIETALTECEVECDGPHIVVLDKGWIFHGNLMPQENGGYRLTSCVNVRKWDKNGFGGLTKGAVCSDATLDECKPIFFREKDIVFTVQTPDDWRNR